MQLLLSTMFSSKRVVNEELEQVIELTFVIDKTRLRKCFLDAQVYLSIFGDKHKIERYHLDQNSDPSHNFFESGGVDRFRISAPDVGKVKNKKNPNQIISFYPSIISSRFKRFELNMMELVLVLVGM